jgi:hypothetical protein
MDFAIMNKPAHKHLELKAFDLFNVLQMLATPK